MEGNNIDITVLQDKFVVHMTGRELYNLIQAAIVSNNPLPASQETLCMGVRELANHLGCCESTIYILKREGVLDEAVKSQVGKKIVFDVEKARSAANKYQRDRRIDND